MAAALVATAPAPREAAPPGVSLRLARVTFSREGRVVLGPAPTPLPGARTAAARAEVDFDLGARGPEALDALLLGEASRAARWTAHDQLGRGGSVVAEVARHEERPRLRLAVTGLRADARRLRLTGELRAYPRARRIRFHLPWLKDEVPLTVEVDGGAATLRRFRLVGADSTLWVGIRPPAGFRVLGPDVAGGLAARAIDIDGNLVNAGGVAETQQTADGVEPEFRFHCPNLRRTPARLTVDVLCVAGEPAAVPVRPLEVLLPAGP
jgi:hypothetical protein